MLHLFTVTLCTFVQGTAANDTKLGQLKFPHVIHGRGGQLLVIKVLNMLYQTVLFSTFICTGWISAVSSVQGCHFQVYNVWPY